MPGQANQEAARRVAPRDTANPLSGAGRGEGGLARRSNLGVGPRLGRRSPTTAGLGPPPIRRPIHYQISG
jgi:hypothetical protein